MPKLVENSDFTGVNSSLLAYVHRHPYSVINYICKDENEIDVETMLCMHMKNDKSNIEFIEKNVLKPTYSPLPQEYKSPSSEIAAMKLQPLVISLILIPYL